MRFNIDTETRTIEIEEKISCHQLFFWLKDTFPHIYKEYKIVSKMASCPSYPYYPNIPYFDSDGITLSTSNDETLSQNGTIND